MMDVEKTEFAKEEKQKYEFSEVLAALRHPDGPRAGIKALGALWEKNSAARYRRFYYEQILLRAADSASSATGAISDPAVAIEAMLCSDEFIIRSAGVLTNEYRHLERIVFLHIPKSGGTTIVNSLIADPRYAIVYMPRVIFEAQKDQRLDMLAKSAKSLHDPRAENVVFFGHPTVLDVLQYNLKRGTDRIFSTLRDPIDTAISALNYSLTILNQYSGRADSVAVRNKLGLASDHKLDTQDDLASFAEAFIDKMLMQNIACATLGKEPTASSAIECIQILSVEIIPIAELGQLLNRFGVTSERIDNKSTEYIKFEHLPLATQAKLYDRFSEDLKLYHFLKRRQWRV